MNVRPRRRASMPHIFAPPPKLIGAHALFDYNSASSSDSDDTVSYLVLALLSAYAAVTRAQFVRALKGLERSSRVHVSLVLAVKTEDEAANPERSAYYDQLATVEFAHCEVPRHNVETATHAACWYARAAVEARAGNEPFTKVVCVGPKWAATCEVADALYLETGVPVTVLHTPEQVRGFHKSM